MASVQDYYDRLSPFYHLIYGDWEQTLTNQKAQMKSLIEQNVGGGSKDILDVACGIGTQAIGAALLGHRVTGSDISEEPLKRAEVEASTRGVSLSLVVGDMRTIYEQLKNQFDVVMSMDNSTSHLLNDADLLLAFRQFYQCVRPAGACILSVRDYDAEEKSGVKVKPYGLRVEGATKYIIVQVWEFREDSLYDLSMYCTVDDGGNQCVTHVMRSTLYAISITRLKELLLEAGFARVTRHDDRFFQPVLVAIKA